VDGLCKQRKESSGYTKDRKYFGQLNYSQGFKDYSAFMGIGAFPTDGSLQTVHILCAAECLV
jgi:hypothetical protein